jgi:hypothetical protein
MGKRGPLTEEESRDHSQVTVCIPWGDLQKLVDLCFQRRWSVGSVKMEEGRYRIVVNLWTDERARFNDYCAQLNWKLLLL